MQVDKHNIKPFRFVPYLKPVLWGGSRIADYKGIASDREDIGESWELSGVSGHESVVAEGEDKGLNIVQLIAKYKDKLVGKAVYEQFGTTFPLLVKFIDAKRDLSLQVHPDDLLAKIRHNSFGKTEMWYVIDAEAEAKIYAGMSHDITPEDYEQGVTDGSILNAVRCHVSHPGDIFYLPAGRIHAIGAGNLLAEIQQTSGITYRIYDYGRIDADGKPRELHTDLAKDAIDFNVSDCLCKCRHDAEGENKLVKCKYFDVRGVKVVDEYVIDTSHQDSFNIIVCLKGKVEMLDNFGNITPMHQGETVLVPAVTDTLKLTGSGYLLTATV